MAQKIDGQKQIETPFTFPSIPNNGSTGTGYIQYGDFLICYGQVSVAAAPNTGTGDGSTTGTNTYTAFAKQFAQIPSVVTVITDVNLWYTWTNGITTSGVNLRQNYRHAPLRVMYYAFGRAATS